MTILSRFVQRYRNPGEEEYVCALCRARYEDSAIVICPQCRGFVRKREA